MRSKTKKILLIVFICISSVICVGAIAIAGLSVDFFSIFKKTDNTLVSEEADFSFMKRDEDKTLLDMRFVRISPDAVCDIKKSDEEIKNALSDSIDVTTTLSVNALIIDVKKDGKYVTSSGLDEIKYLCDYASSRGLYVYIGADISDVLKGEKFKIEDGYVSPFKNYGIKGIVLTGVSEYKSKHVTDEKKSEAFDSALISFTRFLNDSLELDSGIMFDAETDNSTADKWISSNCADMYFPDITSAMSSSVSAGSLISSYASLAKEYDARIYCVLHNEKTAAGGDWTEDDEIYSQIRCVYNNGTLSGIVYNDINALAENKKNSTVSAYSYFKGYNDIDITALNITKLQLSEDKTALEFEGVTSKKENALYIRNSADRTWYVFTADNDGKFKAEIPLSAGRNMITVRHMNAGYTYIFDKCEDIIKDAKVTLSEDKKSVTLSCNAYDGSTVFAFINGEYVMLTASSSAGEDNRSEYTAEYSLGFKGEADESDVSFCGYLNGMSDEIINGRSQVNEYSDNGLGRRDMCVILPDRAETTPVSENDDLSVPETTPQLKGTYGYIQSTKLYENTFMYCLTSGIKFKAENAVYIINGFVMPENTVSLTSASLDGNTTFITFSQNYRTSVIVSLAPQTYKEGYLGRKYNVDSCEAEYVDIKFYDAPTCSGTFDFSSDPLFTSCEWLSDSNGAVILRLHLRKKGGFYGYSMTADSDTGTKFIFKHNVKDISSLTVMIDPGHGGFGDTGTYAFNHSVYEEKITYSIAEKVKSILESNGIKTVLTRKSGSGFTLIDRVNTARSVSPDVFVSIHCDGSSDASAYGTHTFYYRSYSKLLADTIHTQLVSMYRNYYYTDKTKSEYNGLDLGTRFFPYAVTRIEECPSVLVECGYLTNEGNMKILADETGQTLYATAIAQGIVNYFSQR